MKKTILILALLIVCPSVMAVIIEGTTTDIDTLRQTDYSEATLKIIDTVKSQNTYGTTGYQSFYAEHAPSNGVEHTAFWYTKIKNWFDPMQDDDYFGKHEINFENRFFQMEPSQSIFKKDKIKPSARKVEDL